MALHHLGRYEEAKDALEQLEELCKQEELLAFLSRGWNIEVQALLTEAEQLIAGKEPSHKKEP